MDLMTDLLVHPLQLLANLPVGRARGGGGVVVFCNVLDSGQEIPYLTMLMCHLCQVFPNAVQVDCCGTAAHIGQFKFSNLREQCLRLIGKMRCYFMRKRCREVSEVDCIGMFPKMARTHSMS